MWAFIINLIYQQARRNYLAAMAHRHHRWI
jgi:hypothetical protein